MRSFTFIVALIGISLLFNSCGSSSLSENTYLGKLPAIADKYQSEMDTYKEKGKKATDMNKAFEYDKRYKLAKEEADLAIEEYLASKPITAPIPFDNYVDDKFEVLEIKISGASRTRVNLEGVARIKEDLKNKYGGFEKTFFAYIKAVDKDGNLIGKPTVMASNMGNRGPFKENDEAKLFGSIGSLREFENFEKIVFISNAEYKATK